MAVRGAISWSYGKILSLPERAAGPSLLGDSAATQTSVVKDGPSHRLCPISHTVYLGDPSPFELLNYDTSVTFICVLVSPCHPQPLTPQKAKNDQVLHPRWVLEQS